MRGKHRDESKPQGLRAEGEMPSPEHEADERKRFAISGLIQGYFYQLNDLIEDYYDFLDVDVIEA